MAESKDHLIDARVFCIHHNIEVSFVEGLSENGLLNVVMVENNLYIAADDISSLEQLVRMHYDLNINMEGMDAVNNLLDRVRSLQRELYGLKNRLQLYEGEA